MDFDTLKTQAWELTKANKYYWFFGYHFSRYQIAVLKTWPGYPKPNTPVYAYDPNGEVFRRWYGRETLWTFGFVLLGLALHGIFNAFWQATFPNHLWLYTLIASLFAVLGYKIIRTPLSFNLFSLTDPDINPRQSGERGSQLWSQFRHDFPDVSKKISKLSIFSLVPAAAYAAILFITLTSVSYTPENGTLLLLLFLALLLTPLLVSIPIIYTQFLLLLAYIQLSEHYPPNASTFSQQI